MCDKQDQKDKQKQILIIRIMETLNQKRPEKTRKDQKGPERTKKDQKGSKKTKKDQKRQNKSEIG